MKIITKFKDYYDSSSVYGVDNNQVFVRQNVVDIENLKFDKKTDYQLNLILDLPTREYITKYTNNIFIPYIVGFCGKLYLMYHIENKTKNIYDFIYGDEIVDYFKSIESNYFLRYEMNDIVNQINSIKNVDSIFKKINYPYFISKIVGKSGSIYDLSIDERVTLKTINFKKIKSPTEAWQEISMYLPLLSQEDTVLMTDIEKLHSHGMDKYSFRKSK